MSEAAVITRRNLIEMPSSATGSVLIIDDEVGIRESLQTLLELEGYDVETAANGEQGIARLGDRPFDLVLLDLALPDRNGIDVMAEIRAHAPNLSVIMITAYGTVENAVKACRRGGQNSRKKRGNTRNLRAECAAPPAPT